MSTLANVECLERRIVQIVDLLIAYSLQFSGGSLANLRVFSIVLYYVLYI